MTIEFENAIKFVLKWEGGLTEDKNDPGGVTKYGISQKSYPYEDIKGMTLKRAKKIYYENYWLKAGCDKLTFPMNVVVFSCAVNCGRTRAKKIFIASLGWEDYLFKQIEFYAGLKTAKYFLRGWTNRTVDLYKMIRKETKEKVC